MEKAVIRRGIGAIVLALVAALLLGYLLKDKGPQRKEVVDMKLSPEPITIFPGGSNEAPTAEGSSTGNAATAVAAAAAATTAGAVANAGSATKDAAKAGAETAKSAAGNAMASVKDKVVDPATGNPSAGKNSVITDGAGQAVYGSKTAGATDTPAGFAVRAPKQGEVRPIVDGASTVARKATPKSNARLVGEKSLPPVSSKKVASTKKASTNNTSSKKVASSRNSNSKPAAKKSAPKVASTNATGRNKYVVQLLATSNSTKAKNLRNTMKSEGYPAYISTVKSSGKTLYRVRVGGYAGKSVAMKKQGSMKRRYQKNKYVQSSIVVRN